LAEVIEGEMAVNPLSTWSTGTCSSRQKS
jgi:hypothetical protein